jgi:hypothetical protein
MEDMASRETVISHLERVPDDALDEILDFIDFVAERRAHDRPDSDMEKLQESSMASVWNSPEDEVWDDVPIR